MHPCVRAGSNIAYRAVCGNFMKCRRRRPFRHTKGFLLSTGGKDKFPRQLPSGTAYLPEHRATSGTARECKGRSPLQRITKISPLPRRGKSALRARVGGMGARKISNVCPGSVGYDDPPGQGKADNAGGKTSPNAAKPAKANGKMHESGLHSSTSGCKTPILRKIAKIACIIHKNAVKYRIGVGTDSPRTAIHRRCRHRKRRRHFRTRNRKNYIYGGIFQCP